MLKFAGRLGGRRRVGWVARLEAQPTKVKVVGRFHVPSTCESWQSLAADGTAERACTFGRLRVLGPETSNSLTDGCRNDYNGLLNGALSHLPIPPPTGSPF